MSHLGSNGKGEMRIFGLEAARGLLSHFVALTVSTILGVKFVD